MDEKERKLRKSAYNKRYREKTRVSLKENREKLLEVLGVLGEKTLDILDSAIQASVSNPLMGITSAVILADILYRAKVIDLQAVLMIYVSAGVLEGTAVANAVIQDIADFTHLFQSTQPANDPITPTATTIVFGNKSGDLQALMNREGKP